MNIITDSGGAAHTSSMAMRHSVTDSKLRMEFVQVSGMPEVAHVEGMYQLFSAADSTMMTVMPSEHAAMIMQFPPIGVDMTKLPAVTSHATTSVEDLGNGGRIFGHDTHHVRVTSTGSYDVTMNGRTCTMPSNGVSEMWIATDIDLTPAMRLVLKQYGVGNLDSMQKSSTAKMPAGLPIRTINRTTSTDRAGNTHTVSMTMEYRDITKTTFEPSYFEAPAGFQTMDMRKMMSKIPAATMDSIVAAQAEKSGSAGDCFPSRP